jgi:hypothetical protein
MLACWPASPAAGAVFERSGGWLATTAAGWRVGFSEANGSFACAPPGSALPGVLRDGTDGLWRAAFLDGSARSAAEYSAAGARRFSWAIGPGGASLQLTYDSAELKVTVAIRAWDEGVDLQATLEPRQGTVVEFGLPAHARFDPDALERLVAPSNANESVGIAFSKGFFQAQPADHPAGWESRSVGSAAYVSLYGGSLVFRPDHDPKVALEVTADGAAWFGSELASRIATSQAMVNRPPAAGQEGTVLVDSANGAYFSANHLGGTGSIFRIGGGVDEADAPLATDLAVASIERLAATAPAGRTKGALIDLEHGPARGTWAAEPVADWRARLAGSEVLRSAGLQFVSLTNVAELQAALGGGTCLAIVNPCGEALPVPAAGGMSAMVSALRTYVRAGGSWFETGGHPFYYELVPQPYLEYDVDHPAGFADFLHWEFAAGDLSLYGVQPRPFAPWAAATDATLMFVPSRLNCGGEASGGHAGRAFIAYVEEGAHWSSPAVRLRCGADVWRSLEGYCADNGIDRPLEQKVGAGVLAKLKSGLMVYYGGTAQEKMRHLARLPSPALIHFADYLHGGFDKQYPDHLPPNESFGTGAELRAFFDQAHGSGHLVMPYTNPTWWCDHPRGPTFLREGEAPLLRRMDGSLSYEAYGANDGYTVCHWHPSVRAANAVTLDRFTVDDPVDVLFQDQCGARKWTYDFNPASPTPLAYSEGMISMVAADAATKPLATENGWDGIVNHETMLCGMTWAIVPTRGAPDWRTFLWQRYPPSTWTIFPLAQAIAHDKTIMIHHDLGQFVTDDEVLAWTLGLGYSLSARLGAAELEYRPTREWLSWLDRLQKSVCARSAGEPATMFEHDQPAAPDASNGGVIRAQYGPVTLTANLNAEALRLPDLALAKHGFLAEAPGMQAGAVCPLESADDPSRATAFACEFGADASDVWVYSTSDREATLPWPVLAGTVTAQLDDGSFLPAALDGGWLSLTLGAPPGLQRISPPAELAGVPPAQWPGGPPKIGVLDISGQPSSWVKVPASDWMTALTASRLVTAWRLPVQRITSTSALFTALAAGPPSWLAIVNPAGENFPETGSGQWQATLDGIQWFVEHGGHWIETGGYSFYRPAWKDGDGWHGETIGADGADWLGLPVVAGPTDQAPEAVTPTAAGADLLGPSWVALMQGRTTAVNRCLDTGSSDPGHLTLLAGASGDFFGGYQLDGWGFLWRLGGMNPSPQVALPTVVATLEYAASHTPLPPTPGPVRFLWHATVRISGAAAAFLRGDANADAASDISDAIGILSFLFTGGKAPPCQKAADVTDDGGLDISDGVALLSHLFLGGKVPPDPFTACGTDPTVDELTCDSFEPCR